MRAKEVQKRRFNAQPQLLLKVGPYADLGNHIVSVLPDFTLSGSDTPPASSRTNPLMYRNVTISVTGDWINNLSSGSSLDLWCDTLTLDGLIECGGQSGGDGFNGDGGNGGAGASAGGGGAGSDSVSFLNGGTAGVGTNSTGGDSGNLGTGAGPSSGWAESTYANDGYAYPEFPEGIYGAAGDGVSNSTPGVVNGQPGGGASAGKITVVTRVLRGSGYFFARGGNGASDFLATTSSRGGDGGRVLVYTADYNGQMNYLVDGRGGGSTGYARIYRVFSDLTTTQKIWIQSWS